ncbi:MAG: peptide ABC transporter substrate-binding protein [Anaerolineaceae bacterium]|nr:peptide ABC transporter substrate-binding protein [Anaerolineaceae bacterium]
MGQYIRWQAILAATGIALTMAFLSFLSLSRQTVTIPDVGGVYSEGVVGKPQFINPLLMQYNQVDQDLNALIFNGLTKMDGNGQIEPDLAKSWEVSDDGLTYTFRLRTDVHWHDGRPFTADDVLFTISLMQDPDFPGVAYLGRLWQSVTAEKLDEYTIRFVLPEPFPAFAEYTRIGILPKHILGSMPARDLLNHPFNLKPIGTGPFKLDEVNTQFARLVNNPLYAGKKPRLAQMALRFYSSFDEALAAYKTGEIQGISTIPPEAIADVQNLETLNLYTALLSGYYIVYLNLQDPETAPFFQEVEVRQALAYGLEREAIIRQALNGQALVANGPILPWSWAYDPNQPKLDYSPDLATSLLDQAGWIDADGDGVREKEGAPLAFTLLTNEDPAKIAVARALSQQWQQIGVAVTVEPAGHGLGEQLDQRDYQAALAEVLLAGDPDPYPFWHQTQVEDGQNYPGWNNTDASVLLEQARTIQDQGHRNDFYFEFQRIFATEVPSIVLFYPTYTYGVSQEIHGVQLPNLSNPSDRFRTVTDWYTLTREVIYSGSQFQDVKP